MLLRRLETGINLSKTVIFAGDIGGEDGNVCCGKYLVKYQSGTTQVPKKKKIRQLSVTSFSSNILMHDLDVNATWL